MNSNTMMKKTSISIIFGLLVSLSACDSTQLENRTEEAVPLIPLNDTGVTFFIDDSNVNGKPIIYTATPNKFEGVQIATVNAEPSNYPGQDASFGLDTTDFNDFNGNAGFSFTKLEKINGAVLNDDATEYGCVADNITGLYWEHKVKTNTLENELHAAHAKYTWYNPDSSSHGGNEGQRDHSTCEDIAVVGNTLDFIAAVNEEKLCGFDDWRLPLVEELRSIIDYQTDAEQTNLMLDPKFFPYAALTAHRWTSQTLGTKPDIAFGFHMHDGFVQYHSKFCTAGESNYHNGIMLVRGPDKPQ